MIINSIRFWIKMWCLTHLCGCSLTNVDDPWIPLMT